MTVLCLRLLNNRKLSITIWKIFIKIVILELMILIHIDHSFNLNEKKLIQRISENFGIDVDDVNDYSQWGKSVAMLYEVAKIFVNEKKI